MRNVWIALYVCLPIAATAQQPSFEVASVKLSDYRGGPLRITAGINPDGIDFSNVTPKMCIQRAYGLRPYQVNGPAWIDTERYRIVAKAAGAAPQNQILLMLQSLLVERFKLVVHRETREMTVYALVVSKNGPKLKEATDEGATQIAPDGRETVFERVGMGQLAGVIARTLDRPVVDATGLKGLYNFRLAWADDADPAEAPSIFTALTEHLGLKLESRKAPVEMLVVDRIEKPSEN
jgi:uncharacterized protein (TIGR03435 family)